MARVRHAAALFWGTETFIAYDFVLIYPLPRFPSKMRAGVLRVAADRGSHNLSEPERHLQRKGTL